MKLKALPVLAALALALSACGGGDSPAADPTPTGTGEPCPSGSPPSDTRPASTGTIKFEQPVQGVAVPAERVHVKIDLQGARLLTSVCRTITPDTGHMHLTLDGKLVTLLAGLDLVLNELPDVEEITPGPHLLQAEFVAADHGPFSPRVLAQVTFTAT